MSPEHLEGRDIGKESDIWSFGIMLYESLTGKILYTSGSYADVLMKIKEKRFEPITGVSKKMNQLITKCLQFDYKDRHCDDREVEKFL